VFHQRRSTRSWTPFLSAFFQTRRLLCERWRGFASRRDGFFFWRTARVTSALWPRTRTSRPRFWSARAALRGASGTKTWRRCAGGRGWRLCARRQLLPGGCFALWSACLRRSRAAAAVADACQMSIATRGASS
ncbi:unnamed protein product, partial [Ectocarpus sp. 8 AP-2014]